MSSIVGLVAGVIGTVGVAFLTNKWKMHQILIENEHSRRIDYLNQARAHADTLYVPLNIEISDLLFEYEAFCEKDKINAKNKSTNNPNTYNNSLSVNGANDDLDIFKKHCEDFCKSTAELYKSGADAYFTPELEDVLTEFIKFLVWSAASDKLVRRIVFVSRIRQSGIIVLRRARRREIFIEGWWAEWLRGTQIRLKILGFALIFDSLRLISAPIRSKQFDRRIRDDTKTLKSLIKEVTLGAPLA